jgi:hypothetical protein
MWWLSWGDVVAQFGDVVAQFGDVVAQLVKATGLHQTARQQFQVRSRLPNSPEGQQEIWLCMINKSRDVRRPFPSQCLLK